MFSFKPPNKPKAERVFLLLSPEESEAQRGQRTEETQVPPQIKENDDGAEVVGLAIRR